MGTTAAKLSILVRDSTAMCCAISTTAVMHKREQYLNSGAQVLSHVSLAVREAVRKLNLKFLQQETSGML
jgi:hypothetical protein